MKEHKDDSNSQSTKIERSTDRRSRKTNRTATERVQRLTEKEKGGWEEGAILLCFSFSSLFILIRSLIARNSLHAIIANKIEDNQGR